MSIEMGGAQPAAPSTPSSTPAPSPTGSNAGPIGAQSTPPPTQGADAPKAPDYREIKVNGKMVRIDNSQIDNYISKGFAADSKFSEAAQIKKRMDYIVNNAKSNPIELLMDPALGLTKDQIRGAFETWYSKEFIEPETLTPDQKKLREYENRIKKFEQEDRESKQKAEQEQADKLTNQQREYYSKQIIDTLDKSGLPKTKFFAERMAFYMRKSLQNGWEAPMDMIVNQVKEDRKSMVSDLTEQSDVVQLIDLLGENVVKKINKHYLEQLRSKRNPNAQATSPPQMPSNQRDPNAKKISYSEVNRRLRDMRMGKL